MAKIHKFSPSQYKEKSIHNVCRETFNSHENPVKSLELKLGKEVIYLILDNSKDAVVTEESANTLTYKQGETVKVFTRVCYEYRREHSKGRIMSEEDALDKFLDQTGIYPVEGSELHISKVKHFEKFSQQKKDSGFRNCFEINGEFIVQDAELFNKALARGVGTRGSYGFGLLLTEELLKEVS